VFRAIFARMFVDQAMARQIEAAEADMTRAGAGAVARAGRAPRAFVRELGAGVAACVRPGSPLNKLIGVGLDGAVDDQALAAVEAGFRELGEPVRAEISTLAAPELWEQLAGRGYRLAGFENVLVRRTTPAPAPAPDVAIEVLPDGAAPLFSETMFEGFCAPDGTGAVLDQMTRAAIREVTDDLAVMPIVTRYLARRGGAPAGGAGLRIHGGVAILAGSATLPAHRRRGVQSALLARRLQDACAGAELAVVTTAPGSQSQSNMMKAGFALGYARAVLVLPLT
jgi:hypothetical protein